MIWRIKSVGTLNLMTDYFAFIDDADNPNVQPPVELSVVQTGESAPADAGMIRQEEYLVITVQIKGTGKQAKYNALTMALDSLNSESQQIVGLDETKAEWYVMGRVAGHVMTAMTSKITLQIADSVWRSTTEKSQSWHITASGQTVNVTVGGTVEALPIFELTVNAPKVGGFLYREWVRLYNPNDEAVVNELVDITNGGINSHTLVLASKMQSDGDDVRVYDKGQEVDRFLNGMDSASTKIFAGPFSFQPKIEMTLDGTIASTGAVTTIYVKQTAANKAFLQRLPNSAGIIEIDNERFLYLRRNVKAWQIDISLRAVRKSSMAAHADGATIKWIEHDVWLYYGNSALTAPVTDANHQAAYDIATSTNASRVYTSFGDKAGLRPGAWKRSVLQNVGQKSYVYSGNHGDKTANPMTDLGMAVKGYLAAGVPKAGTARLECRYSYPGGITSVTTSAGEKRRIGGKWPEFMGLQKSKDGTDYEDQFNEAAPTAGSYVTITNTGTQTLGAGYKHVRFLADGSTASILNAEADLEVDTVTVAITNPITAALQAEESNYELNCRLRNLTMDQSLYLIWTMLTTETLTIDSEGRTITYGDGTNAYQAKRLDAARLEWLSFRANAINQLQFLDAGTADVTLNIRWTERRKR